MMKAKPIDLIKDSKPIIPTIQLPKLLEWQQKVFDDTARFRVLAVGRRSGKTHLGVLESFARAFQGQHVYWIAPTYGMATMGWRLLKTLAHQMKDAGKKTYGKIFVEVLEKDKIIAFHNGGYIQAKSGESPDNLRGAGLDFAVLDECAFLKEEVFTEIIRPALSDKRGKCLFISTPKGKNWFYRMHQRGLSEEFPEWSSWQLPTDCNPLVGIEEIEAAKRDLPEAKFNQEYLAKFVDAGFNVFPHFKNCVGAIQQDKAIPNHRYIIGVDWAKSEDFTAITVLDVTTNPVELVNLHLMQKTRYEGQMAELGRLVNAFQPFKVIAERNSIGEPLYEMCQRKGFPIEGFYTTNPSKQRIIAQLKMGFDTENIRIINHPVLLAELEVFEETLTPSGMTTYAAPNGFHDDCVMSLAIAYDSCISKWKPLPIVYTNLRELIGV